MEEDSSLKPADDQLGDAIKSTRNPMLVQPEVPVPSPNANSSPVLLGPHLPHLLLTTRFVCKESLCYTSGSAHKDEKALK